jgi:hypothetical protein
MCQEVLKQISESNQTGPIGLDVTATLLALMGSPNKDFVAMRGLSRLSAEDFRNDYMLLLDGDCALGQCLAKAAEALGGLEDVEVGQWRTCSPRTMPLFFASA